MKQVLFTFFAHPDDEAFGPSGSLYLAAHDNVDIHQLCATRGSAGVNPDNHPDLASIRVEETHQAAKLIGTSSLEFLDYEDGCLCNGRYLEIVESIMTHVRKVLASYTKPVQVGFMTFDPNGLSGHIDHITVSLAATCAYLKLRDHPPTNARLGRLKYFCLSEEAVPAANTDWVYMPKGRPKSMIDETIDVSDVFDQKLAIMHAHYTQRKDAAAIINSFGDQLKLEHFFYYKD